MGTTNSLVYPSAYQFAIRIVKAYKLKKSLETKYWLSLLKDTGYINKKAFKSIYSDADEISKMLWMHH